MRLLFALLTLSAGPAFAQTVTDPAQIALVCAYNSAVPAPVSGQYAFVQCDSTGKLITSSGSGSITANSTTTSGFSAGNLLYSDGSKIQAFTTTLSSNNITFPGSVAVPAGSAAAPSFVVGVGQTGLYSTGTGVLALSANGAQFAEFGILQTNDFTLTANKTSFNAASVFYVPQASGLVRVPGTTGGYNFTTNTAAIAGSTVDTGISRATAGVIAVGNGTQGNLSGQLYAATVRTGQVVVSSLPSAATAGAGARAFVTDATACTFGTAVVGGGSTACPVYSDGTTWKGG